MLDWLGFDAWIDLGDFVKLAFRFGLDLVAVALVVRGVYLRFHRRIDFAFSCVLLNCMTFAVCILLRKVPVELGFALGLFGVFGILRYRTDAIGTRDLTYLFVAVGLGMLNAVANKKVSLAELLLVNAVLIGTMAFLEAGARRARLEVHSLTYDNLALLKPGRSAELLADLRERTGLEAVRYHVEEVDLLKDCARLTLTCKVGSSVAAGADAVPAVSAATPGKVTAASARVPAK
jgi:hypothetical protein